MYFAQAPALVSRKIVVAPVKAPKKSVPVSSETGADRTMVGVPTFPMKAMTASSPRSSAVVETLGIPEIMALFVVGQRGASVVACTLTSVRAASSARAGWYWSSRNCSTSGRPRMPPAAFCASCARDTPSFMSVPSSWFGPEIGALIPMRIEADCGETQATCEPTVSQTSDPQSASVEHVLALKVGEQDATI